MANWLAGVDGCRIGWVAVFWNPRSGKVRIRILPRFADFASAPEKPDVIAVDMPIGLPRHIGPEGRGPEQAVRPLLGRRKPSVFSVPSRAAVYTPGDYWEVCRIAALTSNPSKRISKQLFMIIPRIREVDMALRANPVLAAKVFEVHPEVAFWRLNRDRALEEPKKVKSGLVRRRRLLFGAGFAKTILEAAPPRGARPDDVLDAIACAVIARRIDAGLARPFPDPPGRDEHGLPIAIWA
jgi:predicted RNase H-like nuclease